MDIKDYKAGQKDSNFWFRGKKALIKLLMSKVSGNRKNHIKILNVGGGVGEDLRTLKKFGDNYIIDIDAETIESIEEGLYKEKKVGDVCKLPYKDNFFDVVVAFDIFEHISNDKKAVSEVYRVLKKGGKLVFTVPAFQFLFSSHDKALRHKRRYNKKMIKCLFKNFKSLKIYYWNSILFLPMAVMRLMKKKSKPKVDAMQLPNLVNKLFLYFLKIENKFIQMGFSFPFGLSIVGYCKK